MSRVMFAAALAQAVITVAALVSEGFANALQIVLLNGFFIAL